MREVADRSPLPLAYIDASQRYQYANRRYEKWYGVTAGGLQGRLLREVLGEASYEIAREHVDAVLAGRPASYERLEATSARGTLWLAVSYVPDADEAGRVRGFVATESDATERKAAERALEDRVRELEAQLAERQAVLARAERTRSEGEARLAAVLQSAVDAMLTIDETGRIESFNPAAERLFGFSESEVLGRNVSLLMPPPYRDEHDGYLASYRSSGEARIIGTGREVSGQRKSGEVFPIHLSVGEARLGERRLFTGIVRDLTARKELEEQLRVSQKMQAAGQLAGGVAHDFNNILLTILSRTDAMLRRVASDSPLRRQLVEIRKAGRRAAQLTRQLLALSRRQVLNPRLVSLNAVLEDTAEMLRRLVREDVIFRLDLQPELPPARVDPDQIAQVLLNLVVNARDAMPRGGTLSIETREVDRADAGLAGEGRAIALAVRDTGTGMSEEVRDRVFEPYFSTKGEQGTGLGLATVYGIVEQSGGLIRVESREGVGSAFTVVLPASEGETEATGAPAAPAESERARAGVQVLLVEDDAPARRALEEFLTEEGHTVYAAGAAPEAERLWREHSARLDIVVTDTVMPGLSGPDLIRRLREERPGLKAVFMSGHTPETVRVRGGGLEGTAFLQKPFDIDELLTRVRELVAAPPPGKPPEDA